MRSSPFTCIHFIRELRKELGGVVSAGIDLCNAVAELGHRVIVVTCDAADAPAEWRQEDGRLHLVETPPSRATSLMLGAQATRRFEELAANAHVAHLHTPWDLCNFQLANVLRRLRVPYVVTPHGMLDDWSMQQKAIKKRTFLALGGRRLFRDAAATHFTAEAEREQALQWVPGGERTIVIPCPVDLAAFQSPVGSAPALAAFPQIRPDQQKVLFLSRVHPKKGIELLIDAVARLRVNVGPQVQLLIAGPGEESYVATLKSRASAQGIGDATHILGMVRGEVKQSLYESADAFVLPTKQENFGIVLAEAMACGAPVITTRGTDIWQELESGGARIVEHDPQQLAAAIGDVIGSAEQRQATADRGRAFINEWLDPRRIACAYEQMYLEVIGAHPRNAGQQEPGSGRLVRQ